MFGFADSINDLINTMEEAERKKIKKVGKIKVIDASLGMSYTYDVAEAWLNPSNYLMMASNIKNGLEEYVNTKIDIINYLIIIFSLSFNIFI